MDQITFVITGVRRKALSRRFGLAVPLAVL